MSEAREEAERRWPDGWNVEEGTWRDGAINGFILGAEWVRASVLAEQGEGEHVFLDRHGVYHASFGGIGGDAIRLDITREAWKGMGEPRALAVTWLPVPADETEGAARDRL